MLLLWREVPLNLWQLYKFSIIYSWIFLSITKYFNIFTIVGSVCNSISYACRSGISFFFLSVSYIMLNPNQVLFLPQEVKNSDYCEYIRPPIDKYKTLQFGSFDEIKVCLNY